MTAARFFIRPNKALIEKPAIETPNDEVGSTTVGITIPIIGVARDPDLDVVVLTIAPSFVLPEPAEFYQLAKSHDFSTWPEKKLDDVSLHIFGFPTANARPIEATKHGTLYFLGVASRPRMRVPLRGYRALTPASEPRLTIPNIRGMSSRVLRYFEPDAMRSATDSLCSGDRWLYRADIVMDLCPAAS